MTLPQLSVRLGIIIYGELILFPILIQIFSNLFASLDMQKVFATKDMFMLCIFTAFSISFVSKFSYSLFLFPRLSFSVIILFFPCASVQSNMAVINTKMIRFIII